MENEVKRKVEGFLQEGKTKELIEFLIYSNKNITLEEGKMLIDSLLKFEAPLSQMYANIVEQEERKLRRIYETRNKIIDVLASLSQSTYEHAGKIIDILRIELDRLYERESEVREDTNNEKKEVSSAWYIVLWGFLAILCLTVLGGGNQNDKVNNKN